MSGKGRPSAEDTMTIDTICDVLSNRHRLALLAEIQTNDQPQAIFDLAKAIANRTQGTPPDGTPGEEIERIQLSLYHSHVPKLENAGTITFDRDRNSLTLTSRGEWLCAVLDRLDEWVTHHQADKSNSDEQTSDTDW